MGNRLCGLRYSISKTYRTDYPKKRFPGHRVLCPENVLKCSKNPLFGTNSETQQSWCRYAPDTARKCQSSVATLCECSFKKIRMALTTTGTGIGLEMF